MNINKKNDWFATVMFQPNMSLQDLGDVGITIDNTTFKDKDYYKNIPEVKEAFTKENGDFDNDLYNNFYLSAASLYNDFAINKYEKDYFDNFEYDPFSTNRPLGSKTRNVAPIIKWSDNVRNTSIGIEHFDAVSNSLVSSREIAQSQFVMDPVTNKELDWTPESRGGLIKGLYRDTIVYATWDEDGEHEVNGRMVKHFKGQEKYNSKGLPYTELLGNRSLVGKDVVRYTDTLTRENSLINKYDFFDSDDVDKSIAGTLAKTVMTVIPMFVPGVGPVYGWTTAGMQIAQLLPVLSDAISGILTGESYTHPILNKVAAATARFNPSVSDYSNNRMVTLENVGKLLFEISTQLYQQKFIGSIPKYLLGETAMASKAGRMMSLAYMAGTSSRETYNEFKEAGANDRIAGIGMLASMAAMYKLMSLDYFRKSLFEGTWLDENTLRDAFKSVAKTATVEFERVSTANAVESTKFLNKITNQMVSKIKNIRNSNLHGKVFNRSINEAIEETMEEFSADMVKALFIGADAIGIPMNKDGKSLDFNITLDDIAARYATAFAGGFIGGGVFAAHERVDDIHRSRSKGIINQLPKGNLTELVYLARQGRMDELRNGLLRLYRRGQLGSTKLSATEYQEKEMSDKTTKLVFMPTEDALKSQNHAVYVEISSMLDLLETLTKNYGVRISDPEILDQQTKVLAGELHNYDAVAEQISKTGQLVSILNDFNNISREIISIGEILISLNKAPAEERKSEEIRRYEEQLKGLEIERDLILSGQKAGYYLENTMFALDAGINKPFADLTYDQFLLINYSKDKEELTNEENEKYSAEYENYIKTNGLGIVQKGFGVFRNVLENHKELLEKANKYYQDTDFDKSIYNFNDNFSPQLYFDSLQNVQDKISNLESELSELSSDASNDAKRTELESNIRDHQRIYHAMEANNPLLSTFIEQSDNFSIIDETINVIVNNQGLENYANQILAKHKYAKENKVLLDRSNSDLKILLEGLQKSIKSGTVLNSVDLYNAYAEFVIPDNVTLPEGLRNSEFGDNWSMLGGGLGKQWSALLTKFTNSIGKDLSSLQNSWNEIKEFLTSVGISAEDMSSILDTIQPMIGDYKLMDYIELYKSSKSDGSYSFIDELLQSLYTSSIGTKSNLLDIFNRTVDEFENADNINDFIISNEQIENELDRINQLLDVAVAMINAATSHNGQGYTVTSNILKNDKNNLLPEINLNTGSQLLGELARYKTKINFLIELNKLNRGTKSKEDQDISLKMRKNYLDGMLFKSDEIQREFDIDIKDIWDSLEKNSNIDWEKLPTADNFADYEESIIRFEDAIYTIIREKYSDPKEIGTKLINIMNLNNIGNMHSSRLAKNTDAVTGYDLLIYLGAVFSLPSSNFYKEYNKNINSEEASKFAPLFGQELGLRIIQAVHKNKSLFNSILSELQKAPINEGRTAYNNIIFIDGGTGAGKSKVIALLSKMLNDKHNQAITLAPLKSQTDTLKSNINSKNKAYTRETFFNEIIGQLTVPYEVVDLEGAAYAVSRKDIDILDTNYMFKNANDRIMFLDEYTHFSRPELEVLSMWAVKHNVTIVALGDPKQLGAKINLPGGKVIELGFDEGTRVKTPELTSNLRAGNVGKSYNYTLLRTILAIAEDEFYKNNGTSITDMRREIDKMVVGKHFQLKYFENDNTIVGEKFVNTDEEIKNAINKLKGQGRIAILSDDISRYSLYESENIKLFDSKVNNIQGLEYDYIIIDTPFALDNKYDALRYLYTMSQRSIKASIIKRNNILYSLPEFDSIEDKSININTAFSELEISKYRGWRNQSLSRYTGNLMDVEQEIKNDEIESENKIDSEESSGNDTLVTETSSVSNNVNELSVEKKAEIIAEQPSLFENKESTINKKSITNKPQEIIPNNKFIQYYDRDKTFDVINNGELLKFEKNLPNSLYNKLFKGVKPNLYQTMIKDISSFFLDLGSRDFNGSLINLKIKINRLLGINYSDQINDFIDNLSNYKLEVIPYNKEGLLVASIKDGIKIPILVVGSKYGSYSGEIYRISSPDYETTNSTPTSIKNVDINQDLQVFETPVIFSIKNAVLSKMKGVTYNNWSNKFYYDSNDGTAKFAVKNNGTTFILVTDDRLATISDAQNYLNHISDENGEITNFTTLDKRFKLIAVHKTVSPSEVIKMTRQKADEIKNLVSVVTNKNERAIIYDSKNNKENWIVSQEQVGRMTTELLNVGFQSELNNESISWMLSYSIAKYLTISLDNIRRDNESTNALRIVGKDGSKYIIFRSSNNYNLELYRENKARRIDNNLLYSTPAEGLDGLKRITEFISNETKLPYTASEFRTEMVEIDLNQKLIYINFNPNLQFYNLTKNIEKNQFELIDSLLLNLQQFKNGINLNDAIDSQNIISKYWYNSQGVVDDYTIDLDKIKSGVFSIDLSKITPFEKHSQEQISEFNSSLSSLKNQLKEINSSFKISDININNYDNLNVVINDIIKQINDHNKNNTNTSTYWVFSDPYTKNIETDVQNLIQNVLRNHDISGEVSLYDEVSRNLIYFDVSLNDQNQSYKLELKDNTVELSTYNSYLSWSQLNEFIKENKDEVLLQDNSLMYVSNILNGTSPSNELALSYFNFIITNQDNAIVTELNSLVTKYLINNLENYEC